MTLTAPYRFAPIHRAVHMPDWGALVSQDVPFSDGLDGSVPVTITTISPTCVGGARVSKDDEPVTVLPFTLPDGRLAIPPSGITGLLRSVIEVAAFGRLGPHIDERWPGLRDISGGSPTGKIYYADRFVASGREWVDGASHLAIRHRTRAGWLLRQADGPPRLIPCGLSRLPFEAIRDRFGMAPNSDAYRTIVQGGYDASARYAALKVDPTRPQSFAALEGRFRIGDYAPVWHSSVRPNGAYIYESPAAFAETGAPGNVVITGKPSGTGDPMGKGKKKQEFVFHGPSRAEVGANPATHPGDTVPGRVWTAFLDLNTDANGKPSSPAWTFWHREFKDGRPVPVFWLADGDGAPEAIGMAFMFKAPFGLSTCDLLGHSSGAHLDPPSLTRAPDMAELIFGAAAFMDEDSRVSGGRGRAGFDVALGPSAKGAIAAQLVERVMMSPKPGYYPAYVRQPDVPADNAPMAVFAKPRPDGQSRRPDRALDRPELAGVKLFPAGDGRLRGQRVEVLPEGGAQTKTKLCVVREGVTFQTRLHFHNLRPVELGALLWSLRMGLPEGRAVHRLGGGKSFGAGEVRFDLGAVELVLGTAKDVDAYIAVFADYMEAVFRSNPGLEGDGWARCPQVQALVKAATPGAAGPLDQMTMKEHIEAKNRQERLTFDLTPPADSAPPKVREPQVGDRVEIGDAGPFDHVGKTGEVTRPHAKNNRLYVCLDDGSGEHPFKKSVLRILQD
jgi:CRISPR-associated protein (TIGR03986 family)